MKEEFISRHERRISMEVKICDKIRIIYMDGEPDYTDKVGEVYSIDDAGQIHGSWGGCALIPGVDEFEVIG